MFVRWEPSKVETLDGRVLLSSSPEWLRYCEALTIIKAADHFGARYWSMIEKMRGADGVRVVRAEIRRVEPSYALSLSTKADRQAYLDRVEARHGVSARKALEQSIVELWQKRKTSEGAVAC